MTGSGEREGGDLQDPGEDLKAPVDPERQRLYDVLDTLPVYVVLLTEDYHVPFANRFFSERFGESHGKRCYEYLFHRTEPCENCETFKVLKTGKPHRWEWLGPDGRNYDIFDYPFRDPDGTRLIMEVGIDITLQKKAEEVLMRSRDDLEATVRERTRKLEESERRLRVLYESMTEGFASYDMVYRDGKAVDYIITDVNPAFERITGIPRDDAVGKKASELYGTGNPPFLEGYARVASGAGPEHFETYFPPKKQHFSVSAFSPGEGKFATVFTDITERKGAEESLQQSREDLDRAQEVGQIGWWRLDTRRNVLSWSDENHRIFGVPKGTPMTYETFLGIVHPDDRQYVDTRWKAGLAGEPYDIEHRIRVAGKVKWVREKAYLEFDGSGRMRGGFGITQDITDRKQAEEALRESEERFRAIAETSPVQISVSSASDGLVLYANTAYEQAFGFSRGELIGKEAPDLYHDPADRIALIDTLRKEGIVRDREVRVRRRDGTLFWIVASVAPIRFGGREAFLGASLDITDRRQAEERIAHLASFPELNPNPVMELDSSMEVIYANPGVSRILEGLGLGKDPAPFLPGDIREMLPLLVEGDVQREVRVGERIFLETLSLSPRSMTTRIYARDITGLKRAEEELRRTSQYLENLINHANAPIIVWDPQFRITRFNRAFERLTGRKTTEVLGKGLETLFPPETVDGSMDHIRRAMAGERWETVEIPILQKDGGIRTVLWNSATLYEADGKTVSSAIAQGQDITERKRMDEEIAGKAAELARINLELSAEIAQRKRAEETVRKTLSLLHAALESTADAMLVTDRSGRITSYNQNFTTMWNIPDPVLQTLDSAAAAEHLSGQVRDPDAFLARMHEIFNHPSRESYDMLELLDGRIIERYSKPQQIGNAIVGRVFSFRDITESKRAELELIRSLDEKEVLLREIHHRVKNNLQLTTSLLDMTRMRTKDPGTSSSLTDVMMKIQTMAQIHTRLYESKQFDRINMDIQIRDQIRAISNVYSGSNREILAEIDSPEIYLPLDQAIPCALALNEILSNAYKHAFRGRKRGTVKFSAKEEDGRIRFTITDNGIGLPKGFDLSRANTLGLKLVRTLVEQQLKGTLRIMGREGTQVIVDLPRKGEA